ncbi:MAG: VanR-ABDEGLN family response regulator transcription factor [Eubacterium sp.]|nr:VanR-ABDEGLN family response regulator transcription factor [Eubacterium sp.]
MSEKILVVDDEKEIADLLEVYLKNEGYEVYKCYNATDALDCVKNKEIDLALLDVMLPDISGFDICEKIREKYNFPVIMLTAKVGEADQINGLMIGADDYIKKPFRPLEVLARVKAQLRRYKTYSVDTKEEQGDEIIAKSDFVLNVDTHIVTLNGTPLNVTPTEFSILRILLEHYGKVVSAEELFHELWEDEYYTKSNNTITVHIRHLREKMGEIVDNPDYIKTVWGVGYKIEE